MFTRTAAPDAPRWLKEFPDFDSAYMPPIPAGWIDESWHNDTCPHFYVPDKRVQVFIDYASPASREFPECDRFSVHFMDDDDETTSSVGCSEWPTVLELVQRLGASTPTDAPKPASETPDELWIVAYGSPVAGFRLHGPFPSLEAANQWGEDMGEGGEWPMRVHPVDALTPHHLYPCFGE